MENENMHFYFNNFSEYVINKYIINVCISLVFRILAVSRLYQPCSIIFVPMYFLGYTWYTPEADVGSLLT